MKGRLSVLYFLQFAVWGCYLTSLGQFLGAAGLGKDIAWFYAAIGIVSICTPPLMGHLADRLVSPSRLLGICHFTASFFMLGAWIYATRTSQLDFYIFYPVYLLFLAFYMPTMALSNVTTFGIFRNMGKDPIDSFPYVRIWGTVGFVCAMWLVNSTYWHNGVIGWTLSEIHPMAPFRFQYTASQLLCSALTGMACAIYAFTLPALKVRNKGKAANNKVFEIFQLKKIKKFFLYQTETTKGVLSKTGIFLIFVGFIGVCLQISNGFATPFISHFMGDPRYASSFASGNATMLFSLSQISEAILILTAGRALKSWGIGTVFSIGILAWALRFLFFGIGNPEDGLIFLILSMGVYGVAFNFITIAGHLHIDRVSPEGCHGLGQGMMMLMGNGIGATAGVIIAGAVINHWCNWEMVSGANGSMMRLFMGDWATPWLIFATYSFILATAWILLFCLTKKHKDISTLNENNLRA